jgi:hypothetical protein
MGETWFEKETENFEQLPSVKIKDGETVEMKFLDTGRTVFTENGDRIIFSVEVKGEKMSFWLNPKNFTLRDPLAALMREKKLVNAVVKVKREGLGKKSTKYFVVKG